jgi:trehalose 6-phosphate synthase
MVHLDLLCKFSATSCRKRNGRLVVVSNRVPSRSSASEPAAGGLAVAMDVVLKQRGGLWFGWSGNTSEEGSSEPRCRTLGSLS